MELRICRLTSNGDICRRLGSFRRCSSRIMRQSGFIRGATRAARRREGPTPPLLPGPAPPRCSARQKCSCGRDTPGIEFSTTTADTNIEVSSCCGQLHVPRQRTNVSLPHQTKAPMLTSQWRWHSPQRKIKDPTWKHRKHSNWNPHCQGSGLQRETSDIIFCQKRSLFSSCMTLEGRAIRCLSPVMGKLENSEACLSH